VDLTTLITVAGVLLGLIVGDAAFLGEALHVTISIPTKLESEGLSKATAEQLFAAELNRYTQIKSPIATPSVDTSSAPSWPVALARPLQLEELVYSIQASVRDYGVVSVTGSVVADQQGAGLKMFMVISNPPDPPVARSLLQPDGSANALIAKAARETMVAIGPFKVAITDFEDGLSGDPAGFERSKETIAIGLMQPWDPREAGATETAMLINLRGMLAIRDGDMAAAENDFVLGKTIPGANQQAYVVMALNQAFLAIADQRPVAAALHCREAVAYGHPLQPRSMTSRLRVLSGLIAWSEGNLAAAEQDFRAAIAISDDTQMPHRYLAALMAARGDAAGAEAERNAAIAARRFDPKSPSVAQTLFQLDPVHGGYRPVF
jgi:hypothetical protein